MRKITPEAIVPALTAVLLLSSGLFLAQDVLRTKVDLVVVPVSVRDQKGSLVENLTQDDFTILEDGKPQSISHFSADPQPLSAVIVIDTGMNRAELDRFLWARKHGFVTHSFTESDEVAIYRYDHFVTKLLDFTKTPRAIDKSFEAVREIAERKPEEGEPRTKLGPSPLRWILDRTQIGSRGAPPTATTPSPAPVPGTSSPTAVCRILHDAVFTAATDLGKRPHTNRKIVVLISDGQVGGTNGHSQGETIQRLLQDGIEVYAIAANMKIFEHLTALSSYSNGTGGAVFDGGSEQAMAESFGKLIEQARDQYVLDYASTNEVSGTLPIYRKIDVKTRDPKLKITHRPGYLQYP